MPLNNSEQFKILINPSKELPSTYRPLPRNYVQLYREYYNSESPENDSQDQEAPLNPNKRKSSDIYQEIEKKIENTFFHKKIVKIENRELIHQKPRVEPTLQEFLNSFPYLNSKVSSKPKTLTPC